MGMMPMDFRLDVEDNKLKMIHFQCGSIVSEGDLSAFLGRVIMSAEAHVCPSDDE